MENITLTNEQQEAYDAIGNYKSLFISGSAGVGKTIIITEKLKKDDTEKYVLCATTNQAAKVLTQKLSTGYQVPTLHSVLGMFPVYDGSTKDERKIIDFTFQTKAILFFGLKGKHLIIDEASIICKKVQDYLMELLKFGHIESISFIGDKYQLSCVAGEPFDYNLVDKVIELTQVKRANNDELLEYYNHIRKEVVNKEVISIFAGSHYIHDKEEFVNYMKSVEGSKVIISYTNAGADEMAELIDSKEVYSGQICTALSACSYKHEEASIKFQITTNSTITIEEIYRDYNHMKRIAINNDYEYELPKEPIGMEISLLKYVKVSNELGESGYISVWNGRSDEKEKLYLNKMTREYRTFQDKVKASVPENVWKQYAKNDGYLKTLKPLKDRGLLAPYMIKNENLYWHNFHVIKDALPVRSYLSTTAYRAQGITVDVVGINLIDIERFNDANLEYVAFTRASNEIVYLGEEYEEV